MMIGGRAGGLFPTGARRSCLTCTGSTAGQGHRGLKAAVDAWFDKAHRATWDSMASETSLKDPISNGIDFATQIVPADYDKIDVRTVSCERHQTDSK